MTDATTVHPLYDTYNRAALRFERGEGIWLITEDGERYIDFAAGMRSIPWPFPSAFGRDPEDAGRSKHLSNNACPQEA